MITNFENELLNKLSDALDVLFDEFGEKYCSNCPKSTEVDSFSENLGCCEHCAINNGYFDQNIKINNNLELLKKEYDFSDKYGFFDPESNFCVLPRRLRSSTCLMYCCDIYIRNIAINIVRAIEEIRLKNDMLT